MLLPEIDDCWKIGDDKWELETEQGAEIPVHVTYDAHGLVVHLENGEPAELNARSLAMLKWAYDRDYEAEQRNRYDPIDWS